INRIRRITSARDRPRMRALSRWWGGSFSASTAMNTRLSMPSTISRVISASRPAHTVGSESHSNMVDLHYGGAHNWGEDGVGRGGAKAGRHRIWSGRDGGQHL